jgi:hypothetical protein
MKRSSNNTSGHVKRPNSAVSLTVDVVEDEYKAQRLALLEKHGLKQESFIDEDGMLSDALIHTVRISRMTDFELYMYDAKKQLHVISPYNEYVTFLYLKRACIGLATSSENEHLQSIYSKAEQNAVDRYIKFSAKHRPKLSKIVKNSSHAEADSNLIKWCLEEGASVNGIEIKCFKGIGRALVAKEDVTRDQVLIKLPRSSVICSATAIEYNPVFASLKQAQVEDDAIVTLFLMLEKANPNSKWKHYLNSLPSIIKSHPLYFSEEALAILEGTPLHDEVQQAKDRLVHFATTMFPFLFEHFPDTFKETVFTIENLIWARVMIDSRAFSFQELGTCLLPLIDHANTSFTPQIESKGYYIPDTDSIELVAMHNCKKGDQMNICYGPYSNRELLMSYGFVMEQNPYDRFAIDFEIPEEDKADVQETKRQILARNELSVENHYFTGVIPDKMLATLRVCLANDNDLGKIKKGSSVFNKINQENEERVKGTITGTLEMFVNMLETAETVNTEEDMQVACKFRQMQRSILHRSHLQAAK